MGETWVSAPSICDRRLLVCLIVPELVFKAAWQAERKSIWLLPSSWMTYSSRPLMTLAFCLWSDSAWEAPQVSASLMTAEQMVSASLMATEQTVLASWMAWVQMALASLMDSAVLEAFQQRSIASSLTAFHLWSSMDDLVANSSSMVLLAFSQSWPASVGGLTPLNLGAAAMGDMVVGTSPNEASAISTSSWALTWDEVSTALGSSFSLWGGGVSTTTGFGLFGVEFPDPWPDVSILPEIEDSLPLWTCWPLFPVWGSGLEGPGYDDSRVSTKGQCLLVWLFHHSCGMSISRYMDLPPVRLMPLARDSAGRLWQGPYIHSTLLGRWPAGLRQGAGGLPVGWFFLRWSYQPFLEAGCLGAPP